jgi:hypothetical protein
MNRGIGSKCKGNLSEAAFCAFSSNEDQRLANHTEKRSAVRYPHEEPIILETQTGQLIGAIVRNYGKNGLYFESDFHAVRGSIVRIRNESTLACSESGGCNAEIRWTRPLDDSQTDYRFGTGAQFC